MWHHDQKDQACHHGRGQAYAASNPMAERAEITCSMVPPPGQVAGRWFPLRRSRHVETCLAEDGDDFGKTDVTMTVKMSDDASLLRRGGSEIDGQHSAAGLQHSSNLGGTLTA